MLQVRKAAMNAGSLLISPLLVMSVMNSSLAAVYRSVAVTLIYLAIPAVNPLLLTSYMQGC